MPTDPSDGGPPATIKPGEGAEGAPPAPGFDTDPLDPLDRLYDVSENLTDIERELLDRDQDGLINTEYLLDEIDASREATQDAIRGVITAQSLPPEDPGTPSPRGDAEPVTVSVALIGAISGLIAAASGGITAWTETREARARAKAAAKADAERTVRTHVEPTTAGEGTERSTSQPGTGAHG